MRPPAPDPDPDATGHEQPTGRRRRWLRLAGHYLEMVVAMVAGMIVLGGALRAVLAVAGVEYSTARYPELTILEMTMTMAVGMAAWMRFRGHGWAATLEMSGAMLTLAVAVVPLVWLDVLAGGAAMTLEHVAMFPLMLAVMLRRRDEYMTHHPTRLRSMRPVWFLTRLSGALLAVLLLPVAVGVAGTRASLASLYQPREDTVAVAATPPAHDPAKATAAILIGPQGANAADTLGPYQILATTGAFNLYTVAPERRPLPLTGGLDLVPDLTFAELDRRLGPTGAADVVIVPDMPKTEPVVTWLQQQRQRHQAHGTVLLSVCYGAKVLAKAGLLDGRDATTSWLGISWLARRYPAVTWHHGTRYVEDANIISTAAVLSGVDGALRVVERLLGAPAAGAAARAIGWRHYAPGDPASIPVAKLSREDTVAGLNLAFRPHPTIGVLLTDGVGELELASAFSPYTEQSYAARTLALGTGQTVRTAHGLTFVPRASLRGAGDRVDRLIVPGAEPARRRDPRLVALGRAEGFTPIYLHERPGFAYDAALRDIARNFDAPTARHAAKRLEYPVAADLAGPGVPPTVLLRPFLLGLAGLAGRHRGRPAATSAPAPPAGRAPSSWRPPPTEDRRRVRPRKQGGARSTTGTPMALRRHTAGSSETTSARCCQEDRDKEASMVQDQNTPAMPPRPDPALKRLERFVGTWDMKGRTLGSEVDNVSGRTTFEWLPGGFFLQQRATLDFTGLHIESLELIGYDPETNTFPSTVFSNLAPTPLPYRWEVGEDTLRITVSYGPLDATFTGSWSQDGTSFGGGWRPNPGADQTVNFPYDIEGRRAT